MMSNLIDKKKKVLTLLEEIWSLYPELEIGKLLFGALKPSTSTELYSLSDDEAIKILSETLKAVKSKFLREQKKRK